MSDYQKYEEYLHDRGVNLSKKDFQSLMSLMEFAADSAGHFLEADHRATRILVSKLNMAMGKRRKELKFTVEEGQPDQEDRLDKKNSGAE